MEVDILLKMGGISTCLYSDLSNLIKAEISVEERHNHRSQSLEQMREHGSRGAHIAIVTIRGHHCGRRKAACRSKNGLVWKMRWGSMLKLSTNRFYFYS